MNPEHSAIGMAMIAHDLSDAMERLVDRASRPQSKNNREAAQPNKRAATNR
jgi:hypothetical protein